MSVAVSVQQFVVRFLGELNVERTDHAGSGQCVVASQLPALSRKGQALLAFLVAQPGVRWSRERLAEIFWPDLSSAAARNNLRQVLLHLQRTLGGKRPEKAGTSTSLFDAFPSALVADRQSIRFEPAAGLRVDLAEFLGLEVGCPARFDAVRATPDSRCCAACIDRMEGVAGLYRGEFLCGFSLDECPEFDDWLQRQREILAQRARALLERLAKCCENQGALARALVFVQRWLELDPWNEQAVRQAMTLSVLDGQRGCALSVYDALCRNLQAELGVLPEEATRQLAATIHSGNFAPPAVTPTESALLPNNLATERRQVTVLSCRFDLEGAAGRDQEETMERLRQPLDRASVLLQSQYGHVTRAHDGGLMAYFGYPQALEGAALHALRAALALHGENFVNVTLRIGIHTGLMLTGSDPRFPDLVGQTSNRTLRLSEIAGAGDVLLSSATHELVAEYINSERFGSDPGDDATSEVFRLLDAKVASHRLEGAGRLTPLCGRDSERSLLKDAWRRACGGERTALLLNGDPGIGKSRLVYELCRSTAGEARTLLHLRCSPELRQSPFHPVINLCARRFGFQPGDTPEIHFSRLARALEMRGAGAEAGISLLAALLGLPVAPPYKPPACTPQLRRERTINFLLDRCEYLAARQPLLLVVEDMHWIDPSTLELLTRLFQRRSVIPTLIVMTARPEFDVPWPAPTVTYHTLLPLAEKDVQAMIEVSGLRVPPDVLPDIVRRSDGIPLFAEELAKAAGGTMAGPVEGARGNAGSGGRDAAFIPAGLHDLLAARLDALGEAKAVAQLAATIGGVVSRAMFGAMCPAAPAAIDSALERLRNAGLMAGCRETGYEFRHALFKDAAYASQTLADRRAMHRRIAETLEADFPKVATTRPEIIAHNWAEGGEPAQAVRWWVRAARLAHLNDAHKESLSHACAGLEQLLSLDHGRPMAECELSLQVSRGMASYAIEGYASSQALAAYARAVELSESVGATPEAFAALWGLWASTSSHSDWTQALELARRLLRMAQRARDPIQKQQAHFAVGNIQFWRGEFAEARKHLCRAMALYRPEHNEALIAGYGESAYVTSGAYLSWTLCALGLSEQALEVGRQAVATAREVDHPFSLGYALTFHTVLHRMLRRPEATRVLAEETIELADLHGFPLWRTGAAINRGWARIVLGDAAGLDELRACTDSIRSLMNGIVVIALEILADGLRLTRRIDEALVVIEEAQYAAAGLDDHHVEAELLRLKGDCLLARSRKDTVAAARCFQQALSIAQGQGARLYEERAATALASLLATAAVNGE